jgi:hypothetical protein
MGDGKKWGRKNMAGGTVPGIDGAGKEMKEGKIKGRGREGGEEMGKGRALGEKKNWEERVEETKR